MGRAGAIERMRGAVGPVSLATERAVPLLTCMHDVIPGGALRRGSTVVVTGGEARPYGATSLALALAAGASLSGSWCAVVGVPDLGALAAAELGMVLERTALVPVVDAGRWVAVVGALVDAVDVVIARPPAHVRAGDARRLTTRARERGTVLIPVLGAAGPWAEGADVRLAVAASQWEGPGRGEGRLTGRRLEVVTGGRGAAARERRVALRLPPGAGTPGTTYAGMDIDRLPDAIPVPERLEPAG